MIAFHFTYPQSSSDVTHSNIYLLNSNDFIFNSWNESYIGQRAMWDDMRLSSSGPQHDVRDWTMRLLQWCLRLNASAMTFAFLG
jgi:hypothetical protein